MCHGPLFKQILRFGWPIMLSSLFNVLYSMADLLVVGRFGNHRALGAVGASGFIVSLFFCISAGSSVGAMVLVSRSFGANDWKKLRRVIRSAMTFAIGSGLVMGLLGIISARWMLEFLKTPADIMDGAVLYLRIFLSSTVFCGIYSYGAAVLRGVGDAKRPFFYITLSGFINVVLNLIFVVCFDMYESGVALSTAIAKAVSALLVLQALFRNRNACHFSLKYMGVDWKILKEILWIGIPAGLHGALFSLSSMIMQSAINSFGSAAVAGATVAFNIDALLHVVSFAMGQAVVSFVGQNIGGKCYDRMYRSMIYCAAISGGATFVLGGLCSIFAPQLIALYNNTPDVVLYGVARGRIVFAVFFLTAILEVLSGSLRGIGKSVSCTVIALAGACGIRVLWVWCIFPYWRSMEGLAASYAVSWIVSVSFSILFLWWYCRKMFPPFDWQGFRNSIKSSKSGQAR